MSDFYVEKGGKKLRCGFTTGSCAAAAAKAALKMLLSKEEISNVSVATPGGITYIAEITDISRDDIEGTVSCAVVKDGGDDPDATSGMKIFACVRLNDTKEIIIEGGEGIGRVTKPGLDRKVGDAAINTVPLGMIDANLREVFKEYGISGVGATVIISAPEGAERAMKTFNPKLGIEGGISILGTTGIVEPMSDKAIVDTIRAELNINAAKGRNGIIAAPGNYGLKFLKDLFDVDEEDVVMSSNYIYDTVKMTADMGFEELLFVGHIGKLIKVADGIKNTHSSYGDHRMEIIADIAEPFVKDRPEILTEINECVMTEAAIRILDEAGLKRRVFDLVAIKVKENMEKWSDGRLKVETILFSNEQKFLAETKEAKKMLERRKGE